MRLLEWVRSVGRGSEAPAADAAAQTVTVGGVAVQSVDLRALPSARHRIVGSANYVSDRQRAVYGGTEYVLVREPSNRHDADAVAVYGKGQKVGYLSAAKAAAVTPSLDAMGAGAYVVTGTSVLGNSIRLWVDVPNLPALRAFTRDHVASRGKSGSA